MFDDFHGKAIQSQHVLLYKAAEKIYKSHLLPKSGCMNVHIDAELRREVNRFCADRRETAVIHSLLLAFAAHVIEENLCRLEMRAAWSANQAFNTVNLIVRIADAENGLKANRQLMRIYEG